MVVCRRGPSSLKRRRRSPPCWNSSPPTPCRRSLKVILIDLVLAGDNAIVIGLAAAGLPEHQRAKAILIGIGAATALRIGFAGVTTQLLQIVGLLFAGGLLLLWVCWKMWRELRISHEAELAADEALANFDINADGTIAGGAPRKTLGQATWQILVADVSMSLDNVLAVAGAAREHPYVLDLRPLAVDRADGRRCEPHRATVGAVSLDRLCRAGGHPLCRG